MSYFDLNDVLATASRIPVRTTEGLENLGFLDTSSNNSGGPDLPDRLQLELPFWLTLPLLRHGLIVELPKSYSKSSREILEADASVVDLNKLGPHFYDSGRHIITDMRHSDNESLAKCLSDSLRRRFRMIMDYSQNSDDSDSLAKMAKLDALERKLYIQGQEAKKKIDNWFSRETEKIHTSSMVARHKKRKASVL